MQLTGKIAAITGGGTINAASGSVNVNADMKSTANAGLVGLNIGAVRVTGSAVIGLNRTENSAALEAGTLKAASVTVRANVNTSGDKVATSTILTGGGTGGSHIPFSAGRQGRSNEFIGRFVQ